jgi:inorganic pyrophosphatase
MSAPPLDRLPTFADGDVFHVVVESPRGATVKLKYSDTLGAMTISRPLALGLVYPCDWGFVPSTKGDDGDPVDAAVYWDTATFPGIVIPCRALALIQVEQNSADKKRRIRNDRILAVPIDSRRERDLRDAASLPQRVREELEHFLVAATVFEDKDARILGWSDRTKAIELLRSSARL